MQELVILSEASLRAESKDLARSSARLGGDGRARAATQGMDEEQEPELIRRQNPKIVDYARRTARDPSRRQPPLRMTQGVKAEGAKGPACG
jgi:hypothetical protein